MVFFQSFVHNQEHIQNKLDFLQKFVHPAIREGYFGSWLLFTDLGNSHSVLRDAVQDSKAITDAHEFLTHTKAKVLPTNIQKTLENVANSPELLGEQKEKIWPESADELRQLIEIQAQEEELKRLHGPEEAKKEIKRLMGEIFAIKELRRKDQRQKKAQTPALNLSPPLGDTQLWGYEYSSPEASWTAGEGYKKLWAAEGVVPKLLYARAFNNMIEKVDDSIKHVSALITSNFAMSGSGTKLPEDILAQKQLVVTTHRDLLNEVRFF